MKVLVDFLHGVDISKIIGDIGTHFNQIHYDSRNLHPGDLFVAIRGTVTNGHNYIQNALKAGANVIVCEILPQTLTQGITYIKVPDTHSTLATLAANFYGNPSHNLKLIGITGTNGKTTVSTLLYQLFKKAGYTVGLLSTVTIRVGDKEYPATLTTPNPLTINKYLAQMNEEGVAFCFMEASSHGIHQKRTQSLHFAGAVFTNLSQDHLDYHKTFAAYRDTKKILFDQLPKTAFALSNTDDKNGPVMLQNTLAQKHSYALKSYADYQGKILEKHFHGQLLRINNQDVWAHLIGDFNAYNLLAIYATAHLLGLQSTEILKHLSQLQSVAGRFQYFKSKNNITAIVDYAHTPDALKNVLNTINTLRTHNETLITVVGCGGDRDKTKRPLMGHIASELSDQTIFTSDNPRTEPPAAIIADMQTGVQAQNTRKITTVENRKQAIATACHRAAPNDIILVAGKGHENYQETNGIRIDFDDFKILQETLTYIDK